MTSREELYELVWSEPMIRVGERFGVSGSYMARVCAVLNVPRPERGYWAKLAVGKAPAQVPLPKARPGDQLTWTKDGDLRSQPMPRQAPLPRPPKTPIRIPRSQIHGLIRGAKAHFENSRPTDEGAYLKPYKKLLVDVTISQTCLDRALNIANDLFNAFESAGHRVVIAPSDERLSRATVEEREVQSTKRDYYYQSRLWSPYRPTVVYVGSVAVGLAIVEMSENVLLRYVRGEYVREADYVPPRSSRYAIDHTWTTTRELPSGRIRIIAYSPYHRVDWSTAWQETKRTTLGSSIKSIVKSVEEAAIELVEKLEEAERKAEVERQEWLAAEERRRKTEDRRCVEQSVRDSRDHLEQVIQQWSNVVDIERFLAGVEKQAGELPDTEQSQVKERLQLARRFLGTQDPLAFFLSWKTPVERYSPLYPDADKPRPD